MSTKEKNESTEVMSWEEVARLKQQQQQAQLSATTEGGKFISFKSGVMSIDKTPVPGNTLEVIVLSFASENAWYKGKYDPTKMQTPACWAVYTDENMAPNESVEDKQAESCHECPKFKWGSDPMGGRGKACKSRIRLAILPGSVNTVDEVLVADMRFAVLPVTSGKDFASYMQSCQLSLNRPIFGVVGELKCTPDAKSQFKVTITPTRIVPDDLMLSILKRVDKAEEAVLYEYQSADSDEAPTKTLK